MKRKISAVLVAVMLFTALFSIGATAATPVTTEQSYTHNFNVNTDVIKCEQGGANVSLQGGDDTWLPPVDESEETNSKGLQIKATTGDAAYSRNTILFSAQNADVIPVGTYTVSIWVRHNDANSADWASRFTEKKADGATNATQSGAVLSNIALAFYGKGMTDSTATLENGQLVRLFCDDAGTNNFVPTSYVSNDIRTSTANSKVWVKWTATVTFTQPVESMAFWVWKDTEGAEGKQWATYIEDLTIEGTPAEQAEGITFRGVQETAPAGTFNSRLVSTVDALDGKYKAIGYDVSIEENGVETKSKKSVVCEYAYDKITGSTDTGVAIEYSALDYNATHIAALTLTGLPADVAALDIIVTPFVVDKDGNRDTANETTYKITYANGVFQSITKEA